MSSIFKANWFACLRSKAPKGTRGAGEQSDQRSRGAERARGAERPKEQTRGALSFCSFRCPVSFHFGLLGAHFPFIFAFWWFLSFHFGLLGALFPFILAILPPPFLSFWHFGSSFPFHFSLLVAFFAFILAF